MESQAINGHEDNKEILEQNGTDVTEKPTINGDSNDHSHTIDEEPFIRPVEDGLQLLAEGRRLRLLDQFSEAADILSQSCEILEHHLGRWSNHYAEAMFCYGSCLLDVARVEGDVLAEGGAREEKQQEESEGDGEEGKNGTADENGDTKEESEEKADEGEGQAEAKTEAEAEIDCNDEDSGSEKCDNEVDASEIPPLQLAWEAIEEARLIWEKNDNKEDAAHSYIRLGEINIESGQFEDALNNLNAGMKIFRETLDQDDRAIADAFFMMSVAHEFSMQYDQAINCLKKCVSVLMTRLQNHQAKLAALAPDSADRKSCETEIDRLQAVIPEIERKIGDCQEMKEQSAMKDNDDEQRKLEAAANTAEPITDISHLVRKPIKRSNGESMPDNGPEVKRLRNEQEANGEAENH